VARASTAGRPFEVLVAPPAPPARLPPRRSRTRARCLPPDLAKPRTGCCRPGGRCRADSGSPVGEIRVVEADVVLDRLQTARRVARRIYLSRDPRQIIPSRARSAALATSYADSGESGSRQPRTPRPSRKDLAEARIGSVRHGISASRRSRLVPIQLTRPGRGQRATVSCRR